MFGIQPGPASLPADEIARLAALRRYDILDTPDEAEFDDFTRLAAQICGTPVAQITLVDTDRQWFKSNFGVDVIQIPRDDGFCAHTILGAGLFEVPNMLDDERFRENPFVCGAPDVRFYAGVPLVSSDGFNIGALCVLDTSPRTLTREQRDALAALGRQVMRLMESRIAGAKERALTTSLRASEVRNRELNKNLEALVAERTAALDASEERFRQFAQQSREAFWFVGVNPLDVLYVSPAMSTISGFADRWFYGDPSTWIEIIHPDDQDYAGTLWRAALGGAVAPFEFECRIVRPGGAIRWVSVSGTPIRNSTGDIVRLGGMMRDITRARELETQLMQSQRIESVGQLAAGIAHDFNNLITVINGFAELAASGLSHEDAVTADLQEIGRAGARAATLTRQLLAFSRKQILQPTVFSPDIVISDMVGMLRRLIGANIELKLESDVNLACVRADCGQTEQVVLNLVVNARDAMPQGGTITIATHNVDVTEASHPLCAPGRYVTLQVTDTGTGMDEQTRARIFEPFFTTKESGKGTGLGLATVFGIVTQSGATVQVDSEPDRGTAFTVYFPRVDEPAQERRTAGTDLTAGGTETILLVEDEESLRRMSARVLHAAGYTVLEASDGGAALSILNAYAGPLALMLTDVLMPGVTLRELTTRLHAIHPETRVLFMSGYTDDTLGRQGVLEDATHFIGKPYTTHDLRKKVREVLDAPIK